MKFNGKYSYYQNQNLFVTTDQKSGQLIAKEYDDSDAKEKNFNVYRAVDTDSLYIQAMNGMYVTFHVENLSFLADQKERENGTCFQCQKGDFTCSFYTVQEDGSIYAWGVESQIFQAVPVKDLQKMPDSTTFTAQCVTPELESLMQYGITGGDLSWVDLEGENFEGLDFAGSDFSNAKCSSCNFNNADFADSETTLYRADFSHAQLKNIDFSQASIKETDFTVSDLTFASLEDCDASGAIFSRAVLKNLIAYDSNFSNAVMSGADCQNAVFNRSDFSGADLSTTNMKDVKLEHNNFCGTDFTGSICPNVDFSTMELDSNTIFIGADLTGGRFEGLTIPEIQMSHAVLKNISFAGGTFQNGDFSYADFTGAVFYKEDAGDVFTILNGASFANAVLPNVSFKLAQLGTIEENDKVTCQPADFTGAYMPNAVFDSAHLYGVNFSGASWYGSFASAKKANLQMTNFTNAFLYKIKLSEANLQGAAFDYANLIGAVLQKVNLTPGGGQRKASFAYSNIQGADFLEADINSVTFTNAAVSLDNGPFFTLGSSNDEELLHTLNEGKFNKVPDTIADLFQQNGYPLNDTAVLSVIAPNVYWNIENRENDMYPVFHIYLSGEKILVGGGSVGVHLFNLPMECLNDLNQMKLSDNIKKCFEDAGYGLCSKAMISGKTQNNQRWMITNDIGDSTKIQQGYTLFYVTKVKVRDETQLYVCGQTLSVAYVASDYTLSQETLNMGTTYLIENQLDDKTVCPDGQRALVLRDSRENVRMTWGEAMTANVLPKQPTSIPSPWHW